jgi:ribosome-associated translation inhibitor RaiA
MTDSDLDVGSTDRGRPLHVDVTVRGRVATELAGLAARRVGELQRVTTGPLLHARVVLTQERNPRIELPARAEGELLFAGRPIRARAAAPAMRAAIDALAQRLHDQLRRHVEQIITDKRQPATVPSGQWRHRAWTPPRPPHSWRPAGERDVVRRKTFALAPTTAREAATDMAALDHRFYLFQDVDTGADAVVYERADGRLAVIQPADAPAPADARDLPREPSRYSAPIPQRAALAEMDALDHRFLYFTDAATGRGCIVYLRYDGHYGLIEPAA